MRLKDRIALVTGAASGFGEGIARRFVEEGARVILMDRDGPRLRAVAESLNAAGGEAAPLEADVTEGASFSAAVDLARARFGGLDVLVNNAGIGHAPRPMESLEEAEFDRIMAVNVRAVYLGARAVVPVFKAQRSGAILNIASTGGVSPRPNLTWYNASKGWMISATQAMAVELAPFGVRVNALNPVAGETPLLKTFMGGDSPEIRARFLASIPLGRFSTPQDMGAAAAFLCSEEAGMITGVALNVDGGRCI
ncbi:glucose 1-dehydrogenase [Neomegalonema sp.]|uniref:glucose 1-dehydrogenase n=1 Tax=Neomegalonema sp. TaxID=2039713 RepID=UPI002638CC22|nr:glucose 1-dehydrogenase [Neomegalonema sp.]MDD2870218.1 glucose 1-dehydrogenase [Neomegalonema sp.]